MLFPNITLQISADAVAWYGAVIASLAAAVSIYNAWQDRPRVVLSFGKNLHKVDAWNESLFYISVVNRGRRPVKIDKVWLKMYGYGGTVLLTSSLNATQDNRTDNRTLDERNPKITFWSPEGTLEMNTIYCIYASDDTGKIYKKYIKIFPTFIRLWWTIRSKKSKAIKK